MSHFTLEPTQGKRFNCVKWDFRNHSDRKSGVLIGARRSEEQDRNMPALNEGAAVWQRRV